MFLNRKSALLFFYLFTKTFSVTFGNQYRKDIVMNNLDYLTKDRWGLKETYFEPKWLKKFETIMSQGNGYMGIRAVTEEKYSNESRGIFVAGIFNQFDKSEVSELANMADVLEMGIVVNGQHLDVNRGKVRDYKRELDFLSGELTREFIWEMNQEIKIKFIFHRIVSFDLKHIIAQQVEIENLSSIPCNIEITSGLNGRITNSGTQHFSEGLKHLAEEIYLQMTTKTLTSKIEVVHSAAHRFNKANNDITPQSRIEIDRRIIQNRYWLALSAGEKVVIEKISSIHTSRDINQTKEESNQTRSLRDIKYAFSLGYETLCENSKEAWKKEVWDRAPIRIKSSNSIDQLAIYFAQYHLHVMTPAHDARMNIGAKGLSGEGYKGHTFWDTEIFMLPYFTFNHPEIARNLVKYRHESIEGARKKARGNNLKGAQYPWESAWINDGETTPDWGPADIVTGTAMRIWTGILEIHITGDVTYGLKQYVDVTNDTQLLEEFGYEIILETAEFWNDRLEWNNQLDRYEINNVIGPDEYKEHINNNAYTNYIAHWNLTLALKMIRQLKQDREELYIKFDEAKDLVHIESSLQDKITKLYLPLPNEEGIIPQDDTYLNKKVIDLMPYKEASNVGTLFHDYNMEQVNQMQISKQADVMLLIYLFESLFAPEDKLNNWNYYEAKTVHDSSLSYSTHSTLAADLRKMDLSYDMFKKAIDIDMGLNMESSDAGIHAASMGGIWQMIIFGYGGIRNLDGKLRIEPCLPEEWEELTYTINWHDSLISVTVFRDRFIVKSNTVDETIEFEFMGNKYKVNQEIELKLT